MNNRKGSLIKRNEPPDQPGIYYFQDEEVIKRFGDKAFYICIVGEVVDNSRGLFVNYHRTTYQFPIQPHDLTARFNYPEHRHEPVKNLIGIWWGPLPEPGDLA
jgi:hypothetical protein